VDVTTWEESMLLARQLSSVNAIPSSLREVRTVASVPALRAFFPEGDSDPHIAVSTRAPNPCSALVSLSYEVYINMGDDREEKGRDFMNF